VELYSFSTSALRGSWCLKTVRHPLVRSREMPQPVRMLWIGNQSPAPAGNRTRLFNGYGDASRVKRPGREDEYPPPSIAEVKNVYPMCLTNCQGEYLDLRQKKQQDKNNDTPRSIIIYILHLTLFWWSITEDDIKRRCSTHWLQNIKGKRHPGNISVYDMNTQIRKAQKCSGKVSTGVCWHNVRDTSSINSEKFPS
jgi:hypothetical protein